MIANYHTHTPRCRHAVGAEREYVERALAGGFSELGFSDHTPWFFDVPGYYSTFRMRPEQLEDYVTTLLALREEYSGRLSLHIGLEAEYYPRLFPKLLDFLRQFPLDYLILGQHALYNEVEGFYPTRPTADERLLDQYRGQSLEALETGLFTYFAHPDLINYVGDREVYGREMEKLCRKALETGTPLEINLLGLAGGRHYPNPDFWKIAAKVGNEVVLGTDAHRPEQLLDKTAEARALRMVKELGLHILDKPLLRLL